MTDSRIPVGVADGRGAILTARDLGGCEHRLALDAGVVDGVSAHDAALRDDDPSARRRKDAAALHRARVSAMVAGLHSDEPGRFVRVEGPSRGDRVGATMAACADGVDWIADALLPPDRAAGRRGGAELLVRVHDGYVPVIVVNHRVAQQDPSRLTTDGPPVVVTSPVYRWLPAPDPTRTVRRNRRDLLRLAHLRRLLEHTGYASRTALAGSIGLDADCIVVHDVTDVLAGYDETLRRRRAIADGVERTVPSRVGECRSCRWWSRCEPELVRAHDVSLVVNGAQADAVRAVGIATVDALAEVTGPVPSEWPGGNFDDAVVIARAWLRGVPLVRRVQVPAIARADVEVDVDMESYGEDGAYLWGTLLTDRAEPSVVPTYRPFVTWRPLPTDDEARSFAEFWRWLCAQREQARAQGKTFAAYCYSRSAENRWLLGSARRFAGRPGVPAVADVEAFIGSEQWVDVFEAVGDNFVCPHGKGLKRIAPVAGFAWRDPDAGGEASMEWYSDAVGFHGHPDDRQRERILRYNEDDVWATKVLREWIDGPAATAIPHREEL